MAANAPAWRAVKVRADGCHARSIAAVGALRIQPRNASNPCGSRFWMTRRSSHPHRFMRNEPMGSSTSVTDHSMRRLHLRGVRFLKGREIVRHRRMGLRPAAKHHRRIGEAGSPLLQGNDGLVRTRHDGRRRREGSATATDVNDADETGVWGGVASRCAQAVSARSGRGESDGRLHFDTSPPSVAFPTPHAAKGPGAPVERARGGPRRSLIAQAPAFQSGPRLDGSSHDLSASVDSPPHALVDQVCDVRLHATHRLSRRNRRYGPRRLSASDAEQGPSPSTGWDSCSARSCSR